MQLKTLLILGRVSNLPTVWSNCLCAMILGGGAGNLQFAGILSGTSLLYVGGMYLNDFCDADFDRESRPERPIPAGKICEHQVLMVSVSCFIVGLILIGIAGFDSVVMATALIILIVIYNCTHKKKTMQSFSWPHVEAAYM